MKVVYCDSCQDVSILSSLERDRCSRCHRPAERVPYRRSWHYYASAGILLATAIFLWTLPPPELTTRLAILLLAVAIVVVLTSMSLRSLRARALAFVRDDLANEEKGS